MKHDPLAKTTRIPFKVVYGKLVHFYDGKPITELREGCSGDIVIEDFKIEEQTRVLQYNAGAEVDFLPTGTRILARVNSSNVPAERREGLSEQGAMIGDVRVEIILEDDLQLQLRGTKPAKLMDCKCSIPALEGLLDKEKQPFSVNQAYTRISEHFEPHRLSHAGNVFNLVYFYDTKLGWQPLSIQRDRCQARHERQVATKAQA